MNLEQKIWNRISFVQSYIDFETNHEVYFERIGEVNFLKKWLEKIEKLSIEEVLQDLRIVSQSRFHQMPFSDIQKRKGEINGIYFLLLLLINSQNEH